MAYQPRTPLGHNPADQVRRAADMARPAYERPQYSTPGRGAAARPGDVNAYQRPADARLVRHPQHSVTRRRLVQFGGGGIERRDSDAARGRNPISEDASWAWRPRRTL